MIEAFTLHLAEEKIVRLYHIAEMSGVKFHAEMQVTTLDPPELMSFVRKNYPQVKLNLPEINFYNLIKQKKMLPLRMSRYCCQVLKEQAGAGTCTLIGIRADESSKRKARQEVEKIGKVRGKLFDIDQWSRNYEHGIECVGGRDKIVVSPIHRFTNREVWNFIRGNEIKYCSLYDEGFHRIGCMFCPMSSSKMKYVELKRYPKVAQTIIASIQYLIDNNTNPYMSNHNATAEEIFYWWISGENADEYFATKRLQLTLF